jgi:hypothetical protein
MLKARLETSDGRLVGNAKILPFNKYPAIVGWGQRLFYLYSANANEAVYREAFAFWVTELEP